MATATRKRIRMKTMYVTAHPYADVEGSIKVPEGLTEEEESHYIEAHFGEIRFGTPELDYYGTEYEIFKEW